MTLLRKFKKRKGFTLVECLVAIAVFALLVSVVLMIVANASNMSIKASESEKQLNKLVENVVSDESKMKFDSNRVDLSKSGAQDPEGRGALSLLVDYDTTSGAHLDLSYDIVSGYKNFIKCPNVIGGIPCGYTADSTEFMNDKNAPAGTPIVTKGSYNPANGYYCPDCGEPFAVTLKCDSCGATLASTSATADPSSADFYYSATTGGYICMECNGGYVHDSSISTGVSDSTETAFSITGFKANGIRYGNVDFMSDQCNAFTMASGSTTEPYTLILEYHPDPLYSGDDYYVMYINRPNPSTTPPVSGAAIYMPKGYYVEFIPTMCDCYPHTDGQKIPSFTYGDNSEGNTWSYIGASGNPSTGNVKIAFKLNNINSGMSFDSDYADEGGLGKYWFKLAGADKISTFTGASTSYPYNGPLIFR